MSVWLIVFLVLARTQSFYLSTGIEIHQLISIEYGIELLCHAFLMVANITFFSLCVKAKYVGSINMSALSINIG